MTALSKYQRLEANALWRDTPEAQLREVMVSLGDATLIITLMSDRPVSHWSLPAVVRLNPGQTPAIYAPDEDGTEMLEIADADMIEAIETLRGAIERARPHPGRLRFWIMAGVAAGLIGLGVFWLPDAMRSQTAAILPEATRMEIGREILSQTNVLTGATCRDDAGARALEQLARRVLGPEPPEIAVLPEALTGSVHLPGNIFVIGRGLVENHEEPDVLAGYLLAERLRQEAHDPVLDLLERAGLGASLRLLTTGALPDAVSHDHATGLVTEPPAPVEIEALLAAFAEANIPSTPYAYALDITGETTLTLIEADPFRNEETAPLISEQAWADLQAICGG